MEKTREPQYQREVEAAHQQGFARMGIMSSNTWRSDPRRLLFVLARYKFVAKMLAGKARVLEVGCGDAFGTRLVQQEVGAVTAVDFDPVFIADAAARAATDPWPLELHAHDILDGPVAGDFDAAYALDVIEHVQPDSEARFIGNLARSIRPEGAVIIGAPSLQSQAFASPASREGHVNCRDGKELKRVLERHFHNAFLFSMNDEVVHTGYHAMAHYLLVICTGPRRDA
jgi:2-polyprenyl-3-methyl-5-hydroxy-6-metoxy-1,4-benzoquinol methylase